MSTLEGMMRLDSNLRETLTHENLEWPGAGVSHSQLRQLVLPLTLKVFHSLGSLDNLEPFWNDLTAHNFFSSIFSTPEWLTSWWRSFGTNRQLFVLAMFDSASQVLGLAPLAICREKFFGPASLRVLRFMGDGSGDSDNLDFLVRPGFEEVFANKVIEFLSENRRQWDVAELNTTPRESAVNRRLTTALHRNGWVYFEGRRYCSAIRLPASWAEYVAQLSSEDQKNLVRYERRLRKKYSVRIYRWTRADKYDLPECLEALFRLHQQRWEQLGERGTFACQERRMFYADLAPRLLAKDRLELWVAELDGRIAAVQFGMRYGNRVYQLQEGYDPKHTSDRIGFILRGAVLKQLISEGVRMYDFLGGEDEYKARWRASVGAYRDLHFAPSFSWGGVILNCKHGAIATKTWLRPHVPGSLLRVMKQQRRAVISGAGSPHKSAPAA